MRLPSIVVPAVLRSESVGDLAGLDALLEPVIDRAIIDKNARTGENFAITPDGKAPNVGSVNYYIRDSIVVVPKNDLIPDGTRI